MYPSFAKSMVFKIMMQVTDHSGSSFTNITCIVNQIIDSLRVCLAHDPKNSEFPRCLEVNRSQLHRIAGDMNLLSKIE